MEKRTRFGARVAKTKLWRTKRRTKYRSNSSSFGSQHQKWIFGTELYNISDDTFESRSYYEEDEGDKLQRIEAEKKAYEQRIRKAVRESNLRKQLARQLKSKIDLIIATYQKDGKDVDFREILGELLSTGVGSKHANFWNSFARKTFTIMNWFMKKEGIPITRKHFDVLVKSLLRERNGIFKALSDENWSVMQSSGSTPVYSFGKYGVHYPIYIKRIIVQQVQAFSTALNQRLFQLFFGQGSNSIASSAKEEDPHEKKEQDT